MNDLIADDLHQRVGGTWVVEYLTILGKNVKVYRFDFPQKSLRHFLYYPDENVFRYVTGTEYTAKNLKRLIKIYTTLKNFQ